MDTPICDFVNKYKSNNNLRLHMPGHKGKAFIGCESGDITEIDGADVLYHSRGIIRQSEENAASLFGTARTLYSAEGSSLSIRAMLYLVAGYARSNNKSLRIAAGRNAHKTFVTAAALMNFTVDWLYSETCSGLASCIVTPIQLEGYFNSCEDMPVALYITSPDYLGNISDIRGISAVCQRHGVLLIVDNAHGAYLNFLPESRHPIALGADMCCDSAHKTLPVLTGGGYLHISANAPDMFVRNADRAMAFFASTSPSYLILQSLDAANRYLADEYSARINELCAELGLLKSHLVNLGWTLTSDEPLKVTVMPKSFGYTGEELAGLLAENSIVCEFCDPDYTVMMFTPEITSNDIRRLKEAFDVIKRKEAILTAPPPILPKEVRMSLNEAMLLPCREADVRSCMGRISAVPLVSCPPAIPIVVCGEVIDEAAVKCFAYYGIYKCTVIDDVI